MLESFNGDKNHRSIQSSAPSHKLPQHDAYKHNDWPKRDFSRVFLFSPRHLLRLMTIASLAMVVDTYQRSLM